MLCLLLLCAHVSFLRHVALANFHLPELICTRPVVKSQGRSYYKWSGGFDPLTIGVVPLRIRKVYSVAEGSSYRTSIKSLKMEAEIRTGTGGTGINLSFVEEDENGEGSLFRIDNLSPFPVWVMQDGVLANFSLDSVNDGSREGDIVRSNERIPFALDVPFRQGKYAHRRAATMEELLQVRLALAPLNSRSGIETARLVPLSSVGSTVKLNPSKLMILDPDLRSSLQLSRVIGIVTNDGPTRVLRLVLAEKEEIFPSFPNPFFDDVTMATIAHCSTGKVGHYAKEIVAAARLAIDGHGHGNNSNDHVPHPRIKQEETGEPETSTAALVVARTTTPYVEDSELFVVPTTEPAHQSGRDLIISFRMAFSGFILSIVDSAPAEIAVVTLKNVNTLATWNARRTTDSTIYITISHVQVDNMVPNAPYPVAVYPDERARNGEETDATGMPDSAAAAAPVLVVGLSFAPSHKSGIVILKSVTVAPRNLAVRVDLAFLVRLQKFALDIQRHFVKPGQGEGDDDSVWSTPNISHRINNLAAAARSGVDCQKFYFGGLTILPCNIKLSVAPARALTPAEAAFEGEEAAAIHQAVRKGDVRLGDHDALLGVKIGNRNATPLAVVRGVLKSIVVDALLRLDGASLDFAGVSLRNHIATQQQLRTHIGAHYMASLRQNVPALLGSLSALGNPVGLVRGLGDGVSDFVLEPVRGFQRSVQEMDASHLVDGVARGTLSLARHTVGGFAYSAAALAETFSKNMTVLTLDRRYAQKRDLGDDLRTQGGDINVALGLGSGVNKLVKGFLEGVTGVVRAPIRGAEKRGFEGFAKGIGKGLLGLLVKPIIGISDGFTDVMIGVKGSMDGAGGHGHGAFGPRALQQIRPRRPLYGKDRAIRIYNTADAAASALMLRTRLGGEQYRSHVDMGDRVALLSVKRLLILGPRGDELLLLKYKHIESVEVRAIDLVDGSPGFGIIIVLNTPRRNGSEVEVINCTERSQAVELWSHIQEARRMMASDVQIQSSESSVQSSSSSSSPPRGGGGGGGGGRVGKSGVEDDNDDDDLLAVVTSPSSRGGGGSKRG
jgi:Vacuolar-sorting-associated 13 protein C-terminal/Autophagy-related protein C terminal domain